MGDIVELVEKKKKEKETGLWSLEGPDLDSLSSAIHLLRLGCRLWSSDPGMWPLQTQGARSSLEAWHCAQAEDRGLEPLVGAWVRHLAPTGLTMLE
jgi:hypothetical protein